MRRNVTTVIAVMGILLPGTVLAQAASPGRDTQLQQEMRHRRVIVRPATPVDEVQRDVDVATSELERQGRAEGIARDLTRPAPRQPQLDHDLKGGIQTRALNEALRR